MRSNRGFTLIEVLVVATIVAIVVAGAVLAVAGSGSRELENAARRAEIRVELACERALTSGMDIGFSLHDGGLRFGYLLAGRWQPLPERSDDALRERPLGKGVAVLARRDGVEVSDAAGDGLPQFACFASGELTPFELELVRDGVAERWTVSGRLDGTLETVRDERR